MVLAPRLAVYSTARYAEKEHYMLRVRLHGRGGQGMKTASIAAAHLVGLAYDHCLAGLDAELDEAHLSPAQRLVNRQRAEAVYTHVVAECNWRGRRQGYCGCRVRCGVSRQRPGVLPSSLRTHPVRGGYPADSRPGRSLLVRYR